MLRSDGGQFSSCFGSVSPGCSDTATEHLSGTPADSALISSHLISCFSLHTLHTLKTLHNLKTLQTLQTLHTLHTLHALNTLENLYTLFSLQSLLCTLHSFLYTQYAILYTLYFIATFRVGRLTLQTRKLWLVGWLVSRPVARYL